MLFPSAGESAILSHLVPITPMTVIDPDRWQALEPLLDEVLDLAPEQRGGWIVELSTRSPMLAADLSALLTGEDAADRSGFLAEPLEVSLAGLELGAYRLERPLGQGGMGSVWLAFRADGRFEGKAAVKILNLALLSATGQERFRREGSVLARLSHPGIAKLLDAGLSGAGQPYLVLEYVEGRPIDVFAREQRLTQVERIRLMLQVFAAVGHAHAHLIVHRDLKPSNILVTPEGVVKLLDFGIAKLLDGESGSDRSALTIDGGRVLTPQFAAPEQVRGEPLSMAADVYSLGVLLYLLLSGHHPTGEGCRTPAESIHALLETEPVGLELGDLDNILAKALQKIPADRYLTVAAFADDLERYLGHQPVSARAHSLAYRVKKFTRRNRTAVIAGAVTGVGLIGATIFSLGQMRYAQQQRDDARAQRDNAVYHERRAAASSGFMEFLLQSIAPTGQAYTMQELLDRARELLETDYRGDPRFMGRMMVELADHYFELHDRNRELPLLSRAEELATESNDMETAGYASCRLAKSAADDGDAVGAQRILDRASRYLARLPESAEGPRVQCLRARSALARLLGRPDEALAHARHAVRLGKAAGDTVSHFHLGAVNEVARALHDDGQVRGSLDLTRNLIATLDRIGRGRTLNMVVERYNEAALLSRLGEKRAASSALDRAIDLASGMNPQKRVPMYVTLLAAELAGDLGRPDSAVATYRRALAETKESGDRPYQVRALGGLSGTLIDRGELQEARKYLNELRSVVPEKLRWRAEGLEAQLKYAQGNKSDGRRQYLHMLTSRGFPDRGLTTPYFSSLVLDASRMALGSGDAVAAESLARHALRLARGEGHEETQSGTIGYARVTLARARRAQRDPATALEELRRSLGALANGYGPDHPRTLEARVLLGLSLPPKRDAATAAPSASPAAPSAPRRLGARRSPRTRSPRRSASQPARRVQGPARPTGRVRHPARRDPDRPRAQPGWRLRPPPA
jgi:tetratricopeptide (TPR) repeat protein